MKEIDIILPCYNPYGKDWAKLIFKEYCQLQSLWTDFAFHLFIVNDGSLYGFDKCHIDYLKKNIPSIQILSYSANKGKGFALREAVKKCQSDYILYVDYDFPYTIQSVSDVIKVLIQGSDIVIAVRGKDYYDHLSFSRKMMSYLMRCFNRYLLRLKYYDTQTGLKGFCKNVRNVFLETKIDTYLFDCEFIYISSKKYSLKIKEVVVHLKENIEFSRFSIHTYVTEFINIIVLFNLKIKVMKRIKFIVLGLLALFLGMGLNVQYALNDYYWKNNFIVKAWASTGDLNISGGSDGVEVGKIADKRRCKYTYPDGSFTTSVEVVCVDQYVCPSCTCKPVACGETF